MCLRPGRSSRAVGVSSRSVRRWRARGRLDLDRAIAEGELALVALLAAPAARS